jgi:hypothetical protein
MEMHSRPYNMNSARQNIYYIKIFSKSIIVYYNQINERTEKSSYN